jgi:hypothetical protein
MDKPSSRPKQGTRHGAASGLRRLIDRVRVLMVGLPDLHDAFDPDDLPLAFILRRDSQLASRERPGGVEGGRGADRVEGRAKQ